MIKSTRQYFNSAIKRCFPDAIDKEDPFGDDDIEQTNLSRTYRVVFGELESEFVGNAINNVIPVSVDIYARGFNKPQEEFDDIYDKAIELRNEVVNPIATSDNNIAGIISSSITPSVISDSNDNDIQIRVEFQVFINNAIATSEV